MADIFVSEHVLVSAVRYALHRATYIAAETVDQTIRAWPNLTHRTRAVVYRDVRETLAANGFLAIPDCNRIEWQRLTQYVEAGSFNA